MIKMGSARPERASSKGYEGQNPNGQRLITSISTQLGSDSNQHIWILECSNCGHEFEIKSSNWDLIKCPKCRLGADASMIAAARAGK
jgi:hypothetical protein